MTSQCVVQIGTPFASSAEKSAAMKYGMSRNKITPADHRAVNIMSWGFDRL
jgi:hypothetical protein